MHAPRPANTRAACGGAVDTDVHGDATARVRIRSWVQNTSETFVPPTAAEACFRVENSLADFISRMDGQS